MSASVYLDISLLVSNHLDTLEGSLTLFFLPSSRDYLAHAHTESLDYLSLSLLMSHVLDAFLIANLFSRTLDPPPSHRRYECRIRIAFVWFTISAISSRSPRRLSSVGHRSGRRLTVPANPGPRPALSLGRDAPGAEHRRAAAEVAGGGGIGAELCAARGGREAADTAVAAPALVATLMERNDGVRVWVWGSGLGLG